MRGIGTFATRMLGALVLLAALAPPARAQDEDTPEYTQGKEIALKAMEAYQKEDFKAALERFDEARKLFPSAQVLRMTGYTLMALERWSEAVDLMQQAIDTDLRPLLPADSEHAEDQIQEALKHIATVKITSSVARAKVSIDEGEAVALPLERRLDEGGHNFVVTAEEHEDAVEQRDLSGGTSVTIELDPTPIEKEKPPPPPPPPPPPEEESGPSWLFQGFFPYQREVGIGTAGLGVVFVGVAIGTGAYGASLSSAVDENIAAHNASYDANCSGPNGQLCYYDIQVINSDSERAADYQNAAIGTGITGASLVAVGATLFLLAPNGPLAPPPDEGPDRAAKKASLACAPTLAGASCAGSF